MTDLSDLIERVRAATGPDNDLCAEICRATGYTSPPVPSPYQGDILGSVDAAIAFVGWVLPRWGYTLTRFGKDDCVATVWLAGHKGDWINRTRSFAPTAPIAITLATLQALQSQEPS